MLSGHKSTILCILFLFSLAWGNAQIKIQPSAAKGGSCSGSINVDITGNAGRYVITLSKKADNLPFASAEIRKGSYLFRDLCAGEYKIEVEIPLESGTLCKLNYEVAVASDCGNITMKGLEESKQAPSNCQSADGALVFRLDNGPQGGTAPYQMNLYGPQGNQISSSTPGSWVNLKTGNYELRVVDAQNCEANFPFTLGSDTNAELVYAAEAGVSVDLPCGGLNNGALELVFPPAGAQFQWSNGATTKRISNLAAGMYTLTLQRDQCSIQRTFNLQDENFPPLNVFAEVLPVCAEAARGGSIRLQITGGSEPYEIKWNNGWTGTILSNLTVGNYTAYIIDRCKSNKTESYQIQQATPINIVEQITKTCPQNNTGRIQLNVSGATEPYQYKWSTGSMANPLTQLKAGKYTVTVTDKGQCRKVATYEIVASDLSIAIIDVVGCNGNNCTNAKVEVEAKGGRAPYGYLWLGPNNFQSHSQNLNNIPQPGKYTILVTDADFCTFSKEVNIPGCNNGENMSVSSTVYPAGGLTPNGAILLELTPNNLEYIYAWSGPNGFNSNKQDLNPANGPGNYTLSIKGPCSNQNYQNTFEIKACNLSLEVEEVEGNCSNAGYGSATIVLKSVAADDRFLFHNSAGTITSAKREGNNIKFKIDRLSTGILTFTILREDDRCSAEIKVNIPASPGVTPTIRRSYITGIDQETRLAKPLFCVTETFCKTRLVDYKIERYTVILTDRRGQTCRGQGSCSSIYPTDEYVGTIKSKISVSNGNCYLGSACELVSLSFITGNSFGYTIPLNDAMYLGPAAAKVENINGRCIYELHCQGDGTDQPVERIDIGEARTVTPPTQCGYNIPEVNRPVCVRSLLYCNNKLTDIDVDETKTVRDCCPFAIVQEELELMPIPKFSQKFDGNRWYNLDKSIRDRQSLLPIDSTIQQHLIQQKLVSESTGLKKEELVVFPNPFDSEFHIFLPKSTDNQEFKILLLTPQGRLIHQVTSTEYELSLNLSQLPQGAYFLKVRSKQGEIWVKKLIKLP